MATERYGHHWTGKKPPRPRVYVTTGGYRIEPPTYGGGVGTDQIDAVIAARKPGWLQLVLFFSALLPPLYFVLMHYTDKKYERLFWIENGFDPDSFKMYS